MSDTALHMTLVTPGQATRDVAEQLVPFCRRLWQDGKVVTVIAKEQEDVRSLQQNAFYWGYVLKTISAQARINGVGADVDGWHYFFKKNVLGYRITKTKVPGSKRPVIRRELRSTAGLSVKKMAEYLEQVMAMAATDFGVAFEDGRRWEDERV